MKNLGLNRRSLMVGTAAGVLAAPALIAGGRTAEAAMAADDAAGSMMGEGIRPLKVGSFRVTVIRDGARAGDKINETFGTDQPKEEVAKLLRENFLPEDQFVNSFSPVLVETGSEKILFDTGMGEMGQSFGAGRLVDGLAAAGVKPEDITTVVLTHLHPDHFGGLMKGGEPAFPKARYVIGEAEYGFWTSTDRKGTPAEKNHDMVMQAVAPLAEKATFLKEGDAVVPGITAMLAPGHTPGHLIFGLESEGRKLMLTADTCNHYVLSLQRPDWEVRFDADKAGAAATRKKVFDMIATDRIAFIGYHMPFPAVGFVEKSGPGYRFVPASYQFDI
ncbi:MBL fold metallo-hydrolase [Gellertiella hungarica]|uniref:Glyoxylase-like metal-dependent hydrolase (Beta-lactamase superfamily II) n=1 Tax=Gellertiella hungarica TaxID=1572859 RepID=A0A7W6J3U8_9HYPH|nr:MBL fold metallo-hydrolase [Gellertiella hungarica]MBB4064258.1 glyoxylase-like metal-dependent hydrolase (beta-lactamase superfamily II) [Gellertiella hungarica]